MNYKEILKTCMVRDQTILITQNLTLEETQEFANFLQYKMKHNEVPNWRPIGFTMCHHEGTFMMKINQSNPMLGDTVQTIANRFASNIALGYVYMPPKDMWGYTNVGDLSQPKNGFSDLFGFTSDAENGTGLYIKCRRRNILTGPMEDYRIICCRNMPLDNEDVYYTGNYGVPVENNPETHIIDVGINSMKNVYGESILHSCNFAYVNCAQNFALKDIRPLFVALLKRGQGRVSKYENSLNVISELRKNWCFSDTDYSLDNVIKIRGVQRGVILLEAYTSSTSDEQLQYILNLM